jgi:hypothetical protein
MEQYTYILAPHTARNFAVVQQAIAGFPDLVDKRQLGRATPKSAGDVLDLDGGLLVAQSNEQYIYVKADTLELEESELLAHVQDYQLFTVDTQPILLFWLNVQ